MVINIKYNYLLNILIILLKCSTLYTHFFRNTCKPTIHAILESANHVAAAQCKNSISWRCRMTAVPTTQCHVLKFPPNKSIKKSWTQLPEVCLHYVIRGILFIFTWSSLSSKEQYIISSLVSSSKWSHITLRW